jgi:hypothetical protein
MQHLSVSSGISVQNSDRQDALPGGQIDMDLLRRAAEYVFHFPFSNVGQVLTPLMVHNNLLFAN